MQLTVMKRKKQRHTERMDKKQLHKAASLAVFHSFAIAMYAAKTVFKERASNPKMENFVKEMLKIWENVGDGKVSIQTIINSIETESGIRYDIESGNIFNLRR